MNLHASLALAFISCITISYGAESTLETNTMVEIRSSVVMGFTHPGIGLTKNALENARAQVLAKREPWLSGFNGSSSKIGDMRHECHHVPDVC